MVTLEVMEDEQKKDDLRVCRKCGEPKDLSQFGVNRRTRDGIQNFCKTCVQAKNTRQYYNTNADRPRRAPKLSDEELSRRNAERSKLWREKKGAALAEERKAYYEVNKASILEKNRKAYVRNKETHRKCNARYRAAHREELLLKNREWRGSHPGYRSPGGRRAEFEGVDVSSKRRRGSSYTETKNSYFRKKYHSDPVMKLSNRIRARLNLALKGSTAPGSAVRDLGCTIEELKSYLESKFRRKSVV